MRIWVKCVNCMISYPVYSVEEGPKVCQLIEKRVDKTRSVVTGVWSRSKQSSELLPSEKRTGHSTATMRKHLQRAIISTRQILCCSHKLKQLWINTYSVTFNYNTPYTARFIHTSVGCPVSSDSVKYSMLLGCLSWCHRTLVWVPAAVDPRFAGRKTTDPRPLHI